MTTRPPHLLPLDDDPLGTDSPSPGIEARLALALEAADLGEWSWTPAEDALHCSPHAAELWGLAAPEGDLATLAAAVHPDDRERVLQALRSCAATGDACALDWRSKGPDGNRGRVLHALARLVQERDRAIVRGVVRAAIESERPTPDREAILGTLAHDLRNPLAPLRTAVELLGRPAVGEESRQRARAIMSRQITEMARLIDEMSEFSRLGSGKVALQRSTLDLGDVVRAALDQARAAIDEKQLVLSVELPPDPCVLNADRARLVQALSMLLGDAARRSERGRRLWVRAVSADEGVAIGLRDEELGLSGDSPAAPFTLLPLPGRPLVGDARGAARFQSRIGLGFMLAQRLVELHGGWLQSRSDVPGEGREVVLVLPGQVPAR